MKGVPGTSRWFSRDGRELENYEEAEQELAKDRTVISSTSDNCTVSTVFLVMDHQYDLITGRGEPLLFETMVFGGHMDDYMERYTTEEHAIAGHYYILKMIKNKEGDT